MAFIVNTQNMHVVFSKFHYTLVNIKIPGPNVYLTAKRLLNHCHWILIFILYVQSFKTVKVFLNDVNDESPAFELPSYQVTVYEVCASTTFTPLPNKQRKTPF